MGQSWLRNSTRTASTLLACTLACLQANRSGAQTSDIAQTPLVSASNLSVLPNLMFILDDSGSMMFDALPDHTERVQGGAERRYWHENYNCKPKGIPTTGSPQLAGKLPNHCERTDPPFGAVEYNGMYYNPQFTYRPPLNPDGTSFPSQTSWTAVTCDPFSSEFKCKDWYSVGQGYYDSATTTVEVDSRGRQSYTNKYTKQWYGSGDTFDVQGQWPEIVYCLDEKGAVDNLDQCRRNGFDNKSEPRHTGNPFRYTTELSGAAGGGYPDAIYNYPKLRRGAPHYYTIEAVDYCSNTALTNCKAVKDQIYSIPAPVRYCKSQADAYSLGTPSDSADNPSPRCRKKYEEATGYVYPRYGQFRRVEITTTTVFDKRPLRTDCARRPVCSYGEEMTNFANWFAYYRTRMLMMKTATGVAFSPIDARYRVGFVTINPDTPVKKDRFLKVDFFNPEQKKLWYDTLYQQEPRGGTPLPQALSRVGRYFAGRKDGINKGMDDEPLQFSCQQNFALLTTDGYWSGRGGVDENGKAIGNVDNDATKSPRPQYDGGKPVNPDPSNPDFSSSGTLADVALYYYQTDLRHSDAKGDTGADVSENNVPTSDKDNANWQHMVTFGLGMAEGLMDWRLDYESRDATGDYDNVRRGAIGACTWASGICNWPMPGSRSPSNLDDLWHAAVNGRGRFFYARDTQAVQDGLNTALTNLNERNASGASAATSTPNITPTDRAIFLTAYTTIQWFGDVQARFINPNDGSVLPNVAWSARDKLQALIAESNDQRTIHLADYEQRDGMKPFLFDNLTPAEKTWFVNKCDPVSNMTQCALLDPATERVTANSGTNMVNFLRGQTQHEAAKIYRDRQFVLGDTVNAVPLYVARPRFAFGDRVSLPYLTWRDRPEIRGRTPALYVGANDGELHAFNVDTGEELWAFIPRQLAPDLWKLAERNYATKHKYYVDGSPTSMDVWDGTTWRTILVGGLNAGGRGYYALDVTDPRAPRALWEFCSDAKLCPVADEDLGYSFGNPVITKRASDGRWVVLVTSGLDNTPPAGDGRGYLYVLDALTGEVLEKVGTQEGTEKDPSGLARIAAWADNFVVDNTTKWVYGGDQRGNVWRFDLTGSPVKVMRLARALDANGMPQPITTRPELGLMDGIHRAVFIGTGRYLGVRDLTDPAIQSPAGNWSWQQSVYAFKDVDQPLGSLRSSSNQLVQQTISELSGGTQRTVSNNQVSWARQNGWYVDFNPDGKSPGERVTIDPQLALGTLLVTTNVPGASACSVGGDSWVYQFDYRSGAYVIGAPLNLVARKQIGALTAGLVIYQLQKGSLVGQIQRSETTTRREDIITAAPPMKSRRTSWREIE